MTTISQGYADRVSRHLALNRTDLSAMGVIAQSTAQGQVVSAGDLARRLTMSPAAVTALVDRLERAGHVHRERDGRDRRRVVLHLTSHAGQVSAAMFQPLSQHLRGALSTYSDEELDIVARVLDDAIEASEVALAQALPQVPTAAPSRLFGHQTPPSRQPAPQDPMKEPTHEQGERKHPAAQDHR
ncbi:MAG: MarR family winged helix-turn-helix transcriptional regulator [Micrococcales bacterium]|nr:MarR family winged helix-turn-helix transcriptional regulator [Micrococcales bacterium]